MFYTNEIPIQFNFMIIRIDAIIEKNNGDILGFLTKFNPLHNEFIAAIVSMGNSDLSDVYDWVRSKKLLPLDDYYLSNEVAWWGNDKEEHPDCPRWLTIYKTDGNEFGQLFADYINTKKYFFTDINDFKKSKGL